MNPLLVKPPRRVQRVETPSRPDLTLFVRAITGAEFLDLGAALIKTVGAKQSTATQLEWFVCDEAGAPLLAPGEGVEFIDAIDQADMRALQKAGEGMNALNEAAVEEELKN